MSVAEELDKIIAIEQSFDVNSVTYQGLKVWPLIRLQLTYYYSLVKTDSKLLEKLNKIRHQKQQKNHDELDLSQIQFEYRKQSQAWQEILTPFSLLENTDFLFFSRWENHSEKINGKFVDRCLDPIFERCSPKIRTLKLELDFPQGRQKQPRWEPSVFVNPYPCLAKEHLIRQYLMNSLQQYKIRNFAQIQFIIHQYTGFWISEQQLLNQIYLLQSYTAFFTDLLSIIRPKVVFLACYYYIVAMALIAACRDLNIKAVDVQHGIQGRYHKMYASWTKIPTSGYELLPDHFWVWSEKCKQDIIESRFPYLKNYTYHFPLVGGSPWLGKWLQADLVLGRSESIFLAKLLNYQQVILVSLQRFDSLQEYLDLLTPVMQQFKKDWFFLFRFHPLHQGEKEIQKVVSTLDSCNIKNFDIHFSTNMHLYTILKRCSYHTTYGSTVCHEASAFGIKTGILDKDKKYGYYYYNEQISNGEFDYISSPKDFITAVQSNGHKLLDILEQNSYINPDVKLADAILKWFNVE